MNESSCKGTKVGMSVLRHPVPFGLQLSNEMNFKDLNHCNSSFWKA